MQKRYGLFTAISMVVGIVIGSGIFFKATKVLANNNGDMGRSLLTVGIVGAIMLICSFVFANLASRYEKVNGVVDYAEAALGRGYAYYVAWFMTLIYYPTITSTLGWVTSQYAAILFGFPVAGMTHYWVGFGILLADGLINAYAPRLAGKLQVSATVIKLIPPYSDGRCGHHHRPFQWPHRGGLYRGQRPDSLPGQRPDGRHCGLCLCL